jgi:hypothetical protein
MGQSQKILTAVEKSYDFAKATVLYQAQARPARLKVI